MDLYGKSSAGHLESIRFCENAITERGGLCLTLICCCVARVCHRLGEPGVQVIGDELLELVLSVGA